MPKNKLTEYAKLARVVRKISLAIFHRNESSTFRKSVQIKSRKLVKKNGSNLKKSIGELRTWYVNQKSIQKDLTLSIKLI